MKLLNKRAQVGNLAGFFMGIGVASIVLVIIMIIVTELQSGIDSGYCDYNWNETTESCVYNISNQTVMRGNSAAYNASGAIVTKLSTAPVWIGLIILAGLAFIVLGFFINRGGQ